ncbi:MAG: hypothetical protein V1895_02700 [Parcubacteria group bacterium]
MNKTLKSHLIASAVLALLAVGSISLANHVAEAKDFASQSQVETIEVDFEKQTEPPSGQSETTLSEQTSASPTQFLYLVGLAAIGLIGIVGIVRDLRRDNGL